MLRRHGTLFIIIVLCIGYLFSRSINLGTLPIFNDESTYIRYGLHQIKQPDHRPYSLTIGKEPLMPLLYAMVGEKTQDPLLGARSVSIAAGMLALVGLFYFAYSTFGRIPALFTGIFYILSPFNLFFDRLALMDCAVSAVAIWSLVFTAKLLKKPSWPLALGLGVVTGAGLWIKSSDFFYIALPVIAYCIYYFLRRDHGMKRAEKFGAALVLAFVIFEPLFSNPLYMDQLEVMKQYTYPFYSVVFFPISIWIINIGNALTWLFFYLTPPLFLLAFVTPLLFRKDKNLYLTGIWLVLPFLYEILYAKLFTSRHILLVTVPLLIFAGYGMWKLLQKNSLAGLAIFLAITSWCTVYDYNLIAAPQNFSGLVFSAARDDIEQYIRGSSSGYGVPEAIIYLKQKAQTAPITIIIRNDHGNPEDAVVAYFAYAQNSRVLALSDPPGQIQQALAQAAPNTPVYYVTRGAYYGGLEKYIQSEKRFYKLQSSDFVGVSLLRR